MPDFFISYTSADEAWAEWIAWVLEEAGFKVVLQKWDFGVGSNFVVEMQRAAAGAKRTIAVLSPAYLNDSRFGAAEWAAAFSNDPDGIKRVLIPVRVKECRAEGLLRPVVHADLVGLDEASAKRRLLDSVSGTRRKPSRPPTFPGTPSSSGTPHAFPGERSQGAEPTADRRYMPKIRGAITDVDKRRFLRDAFAAIQRRFSEALQELSNRNPSVEFDFSPIDATKFTAEIFVSGKSRARCKVWSGGMLGGADIAYAEGSSSLSENAMNESLVIQETGGELVLKALMGGFASGRSTDGLDLQRMSKDDAAEYLWRRFVWGLER